jgi:hypothetical protein
MIRIIISAAGTEPARPGSVLPVLSVVVVPWSQLLFGSLFGPAVGVAVLWILGEQRLRTLATVAGAVFAGTWLWNLMLNVRSATVIDGDIPFRLFPISWQDIGTGIFALAFAAVALTATVHRNEPGHRTLKVAGIAAVAAFLTDVYTW